MATQSKIKPGGLNYAKAILSAQPVIRKEVRGVVKESTFQMRSQMRSIGFFNTGDTDSSFKNRFRTKDGIIKGVSILAQRNAFILANVGKDYRWQTVAGRREIIKNENATDYIFPHVDTAREKTADAVANIYADFTTENLIPIKK